MNERKVKNRDKKDAQSKFSKSKDSQSEPAQGTKPVDLKGQANSSYSAQRTELSRQRIIDHGEVFTSSALVNSMLDLVAHECERVDSKFLEPACGNGNFLAEVMLRRLTLLDRRFKSRTQWEPNALLGLACLYGIELLHDNVKECRQRLYDLFREHYCTRYNDRARQECLAAALFIVNCNILHGDALKMTSIADNHHVAKPLVFTEWSLLPGGKFKRRCFEYHDLSKPDPKTINSLFAPTNSRVTDEEGKPVYIPCKIADWPAVHYGQLGKLEVNR